MNLQPTGTNIVIRPKKPAETSKSGIIIPESAMEQSVIAEADVLACGPGVELLKVDDTVLYERFAAANVTVGDETYALIQEVNVKAIVR